MFSLPFLDETKIEIRRKKKLVLRRMKVYVQIFFTSNDLNPFRRKENRVCYGDTWIGNVV
jgi:hypothetical protein